MNILYLKSFYSTMFLFKDSSGGLFPFMICFECVLSLLYFWFISIKRRSGTVKSETMCHLHHSAANLWVWRFTLGWSFHTWSLLFCMFPVRWGNVASLSPYNRLQSKKEKTFEWSTSLYELNIYRSAGSMWIKNVQRFMLITLEKME